MKLLDLYCGAGGCSVGYNRAGFNVVGVDIREQPNYPFEFIQSDVFALDPSFLQEFDMIHASPPCQEYTMGSQWLRNKGKEYPDLLAATRDFISETEVDSVIENVPGAPLLKPMKLCGTMFGLQVIRHRLFESNLWIYPPCKCNHQGTTRNGDYYIVANCNPIGAYKDGKCMPKEERQRYRQEVYAKMLAKYGGKNKTEAQYRAWCDAMQIDWMTRYEITQAIPPAYTEWIGKLIIGS